jgi:hypothetical protein
MRRILLLLLLSACLFGQALQPSSTKKQSAQPQNETSSNDRGTEQSPVVVKVIPPNKTQEEAQQEATDRQEKSTNDGNLVFFTKVLAIAAVFQLIVFGYQSFQLKETVKSAGEQSTKLDRHIGEASRSADAMEVISEKIRDGNRDILRAYLTVTIGNASYQDRTDDIKFEARPNLLNTGNTPARKVCIRTNSAVLPIPIPSDFQFPLPEAGFSNAGMVGAHQGTTLNIRLEKDVPDHDVAAIKEGYPNAFCIWGDVTYDDIFGAKHSVKFGQWLVWLPSGAVICYYIPEQNDGD